MSFCFENHPMLMLQNSWKGKCRDQVTSDDNICVASQGITAIIFPEQKLLELDTTHFFRAAVCRNLMHMRKISWHQVPPSSSWYFAAKRCCSVKPKTLSAPQITFCNLISKDFLCVQLHTTIDFFFNDDGKLWWEMALCAKSSVLIDHINSWTVFENNPSLDVIM